MHRKRVGVICGEIWGLRCYGCDMLIYTVRIHVNYVVKIRFYGVKLMCVEMHRNINVVRFEIYGANKKIVN